VPTVRDWQRRSDIVSDVAAYKQGRPLRVRTPLGSVEMSGVEASPNLMSVLLGRSGSTSLADAGDPSAVTLLPAGAAKLLAAGVTIPETLEADGRAYHIANLAPESFLFPTTGPTPDLMTPLADEHVFQVTSWNDLGRPAATSSSLSVIVRRRNGVTNEQLEGALQRLPSGQTLSVSAVSLDEFLTGRLHDRALDAAGLGVFLLLLCLGNVANLLIVASHQRGGEFAVRTALGADTARLVKMLATELSLAAAGATIGGLAISWAALSAVQKVIPAAFTVMGLPRLNFTVACAVGLANVLLFGIGLLSIWLVVLSARRSPLTHPSTRAPRSRITRAAFTATQAALATLLATGAAFLVRSELNLLRQDDGYGSGAIVVTVSYPSNYANQRVYDLVTETRRRFGLVQGVRQTALSTGAMIDGAMAAATFSIGGRMTDAAIRDVTPEYFATIGTRLADGRALLAEDSNWAGVVVNEAFVNAFGIGDSPIGRTLTRGARAAQIVGVCQDSIDRSLDRPPVPTVFRLLSPAELQTRRINFVLAATDAPSSLQPSLRRAIAEVDPLAVLIAVDSPQSRLLKSVRYRTFVTLVLTLFATGGVCVCAYGVLGLVRFVAASRIRELAIRSAIGASTMNLLYLVSLDVGVATAFGTVAGSLLAAWFARGMADLVFGIGLRDASSPLLAL
jgi:putative ABC transport system permease protein